MSYHFFGTMHPNMKYSLCKLFSLYQLQKSTLKKKKKLQKSRWLGGNEKKNTPKIARTVEFFFNY